MPNVNEARRIEYTWAHDAVAYARQLQANDPSWGTETFPLAGGNIVLSGPGLFVNAALAVGIDTDVSHADLDVLEVACRRVGVTPVVEVSPATRSCVADRCSERLYELSMGAAVVALAMSGRDELPVDPSVIIEVVDRSALASWQEIAAQGWGHHGPDRRRASDAFAAAAFGAPGETLLLARGSDGRPLGCAALTVTAGLATLGGMSTLPEERRRGVQRALVAYRLHLAEKLGCDLALTSVAPGGASERNLLRLGFTHLYTKSTLRAPPSGERN